MKVFHEEIHYPEHISEIKEFLLFLSVYQIMLWCMPIFLTEYNQLVKFSYFVLELKKEFDNDILI
jgi:hypothetical protein